MRIIKLETKHHGKPGSLNGKQSGAGQSLPPALQRLPYQVLATCRNGAARNIEQLILNQLQDGYEQGYALEIKARPHQPLVDFTVSLDCSTAERAALVRLVSRLGMEPDIRSVRWQGVPCRQR